MGLKLPGILGIPMQMWQNTYWINWLPHQERSSITHPYLIYQPEKLVVGEELSGPYHQIMLSNTSTPAIIFSTWTGSKG